ncbi:hypothetical protein [Anaerosinus sp.]
MGFEPTHACASNDLANLYMDLAAAGSDERNLRIMGFVTVSLCCC